jgi:hypothetical protein
MQLDGIRNEQPHLILFSVDDMMQIPITDKEFQDIIEAVKYKNQCLYNKLWCYKFNQSKNKQN